MLRARGAARAGVGVVGVLAFMAAGCDLGDPPTTYPVSGEDVLISGDVNGDGHVDLVSGTTVLLGDGAGGLTTGALTGGSPSGFLVDVNEDGFDDSIEVEKDANETRTTLQLNDGAGGFDPPSSLASDPWYAPPSLLVDDVNDDDHADLVWPEVQGGPTGKQIRVRLGDGGGGFGAPLLSDAHSTSPDYDQVLADVNGDGHVDLIVGSCNCALVPQARFDLYLGDSAGSFGFTQSFLGLYMPATTLILVDQIEVIDANGDGFLDLVGRNRATSSGGYGETVLLGDGTGGFGTASLRPSSDWSFDFVSADFNGDGADDLLVAAEDSEDRSSSEVRFGAAADPFAETRFMNAPGDQVVTADFDEDGKPDAAFRSAGQVTVFLNRLA
ncbi:MAG TPA: VCBS repeat-containing protein [Acidimicrobiales bacterium]|jgi:hypothetical protein